MDSATRTTVADRAGYACEYCRLHEDDDVYTYHVEHIIAIKHGGSDELDNLAFACQFCNLHKGPNLAGIDPETNAVVELFHPRLDRWTDHFELNGHQFVGRTAKGRATIRVLAMNDPDRVRLRQILGVPPG
ncbi:MAG: HNH endonuclease [Planctomycetes bacterium]|nr:HNH endonuclease [Planctomycetota bacterium]